MPFSYYAAGAAVGLLVGTAGSVVNSFITQKLVIDRQHDKANAYRNVMVANILRLAVSAAVLFVIFLLRNVLPFSFNAMIIAAAIGLTVISYILLVIKTRKAQKKDK